MDNSYPRSAEIYILYFLIFLSGLGFFFPIFYLFEICAYPFLVHLYSKKKISRLAFFLVGSFLYLSIIYLIYEKMDENVSNLRDTDYVQQLKDRKWDLFFKLASPSQIEK